MKSLYILVLVTLFSCSTQKQEKRVITEVTLAVDSQLPGPEKLSSWGLFQEPIKSLQPVDGIIPYELNSPLFSDYAFKKRFVRLPKGMTAGYSQREVLDFPKGTLLIKNFYYPADFKNPEMDWRILETRLLIHEEKGWKALTYVWNDEQTEAFLEVAGRTIPVSWVNRSGVLMEVNYSVPDLNQCKGCHDWNGDLKPIGPSVRQLNRMVKGTSQLNHWMKLGMLGGFPEELEWSKIAQWENLESGELGDRARAWLEINCAHCHRAEGPAKNTGLYLTYWETDPYKLGVMKPPVAAGRGSSGLLYGIVPGQPEKSILYERIESLDPGVMMPELGRKLKHEEGTGLIKEWIATMPKQQ